MANKSIKNRTAKLNDKSDAKELKQLLDAIKTDLTAVKTAVDAVTAELDSDANVTANNYATQGAITLTLAN